MRREESPREKGQDIRDRTFRFACRVVAFCDQVYRAGGVGRLLVPQLVNCATSVAGMLEEARAAESRRDFISKCSIGLKASREAWTRLRVCQSCGIGPSADATALVREAGELTAIIGAIVAGTKRNTPAKSSRTKPERPPTPDQILNS